MALSHGSTGASGHERVYEAILAYQYANGGRPPTIREIVELAGLSSTSVVHHHLARLAQGGLIEIPPEYGEGGYRITRGVRIAGALWLSPQDVLRVARLVHTIDDARRALEEHGAAVIDAVIADLERALDAHSPIADWPLAQAGPAGGAKNGRAA